MTVKDFEDIFEFYYEDYINFHFKWFYVVFLNDGFIKIGMIFKGHSRSLTMIAYIQPISSNAVYVCTTFEILSLGYCSLHDSDKLERSFPSNMIDFFDKLAVDLCILNILYCVLRCMYMI